MPVRFTTPGLGGSTGSYLKAGQWQVGFGYRHLYADQWFVGSKVEEADAPNGHPLFLNINSYDLVVDYGVLDRMSLTLTVPFSYGTHSRVYAIDEGADGERHKVTSGGLGDINLIGTYWLWDPHEPRNANAALGLGVKTPSGKNTVHDNIKLSDGSVVPKLVDQSIQLGDGAWGVIFQAQGYWTMFRQLYGYANGSYYLSTVSHTDVPSPGEFSLAVPDVYSGRAGLAYPIWPSWGLSISLGGRIDGIPKKDIIGGADPYFRRPGYILYLDPGVGVSFGKHTMSLSVPVRLHQDFQEDLNKDDPGGDLANYLIIADYTLRF